MKLDGEWDQNAQNFTSDLHTDYSSEPSFMDLSGSYSVRWDGYVEATIEIDPIKDYDGNNTLFVALLEGENILEQKE